MFSLRNKNLRKQSTVKCRTIIMGCICKSPFLASLLFSEASQKNLEKTLKWTRHNILLWKMHKVWKGGNQIKGLERKWKLIEIDMSHVKIALFWKDSKVLLDYIYLGDTVEFLFRRKTCLVKIISRKNDILCEIIMNYSSKLSFLQALD